ncbi:MAG: DUF3298 and DUF4163 domain-containing protein [Sporolactobacillus sp.]
MHVHPFALKITACLSVLLTALLPAGTSFAAGDQHCHAAPVTVKIEKLSDGVFYPAIAGAPNQDVQATINTVFRRHAENIAALDRKYKQQYAHDQFISASGAYYAHTQPAVRFNAHCRLSVSFTDETYTGGAHGMHKETVYNYRLKDGKRLALGDVVHGKKEWQKLNASLKQQMVDLKKQGRYDFFLESFKGVDPERTQFFFSPGGITIVFQEYEVAPYSNGIIHLKVPFKVFKDAHSMHHRHCSSGQE